MPYVSTIPRLEYSHGMALQLTTELSKYYFTLHILVFVCVLPHVFVIVFVFPIITMTSMTISQSCDIARHTTYSL